MATTKNRKVMFKSILASIMAVGWNCWNQTYLFPIYCDVQGPKKHNFVSLYISLYVWTLSVYESAALSSPSLCEMPVEKQSPLVLVIWVTADVGMDSGSGFWVWKRAFYKLQRFHWFYIHDHDEIQAGGATDCNRFAWYRLELCLQRSGMLQHHSITSVSKGYVAITQ